MNQTQSLYEEFQEWLNDCPTKVLRYEDMIDAVELLLEVPIQEDN